MGREFETERMSSGGREDSDILCFEVSKVVTVLCESSSETFERERKTSFLSKTRASLEFKFSLIAHYELRSSLYKV